MPSQAERRAATRRRLLDATRALLVEGGVEATTTQATLERAGVSRGALYHHFASQADLIAALYEEEAAGAIERALAHETDEPSPLRGLERSCLAWLDEAARPDVARILAVEGPAAIGWDRCREIESAHSLGRVRAGLLAAARAGEVDGDAIDLTARVVNSALTEAALAIVGARQKKRARREAELVIARLFAGLRVTGRPPE